VDPVIVLIVVGVTDFERAMDDLEQAYGRAPEEE
jgi:hypothetical protein